MNNNSTVIEIINQIREILVALIGIIGTIIVAVIYMRSARDVQKMKSRTEYIIQLIKDKPPADKERALQKELRALSVKKQKVSRKNKRVVTFLLPPSIFLLILGFIISKPFSRSGWIMSWISKPTITPTLTSTLLPPTASPTPTLTMTAIASITPSPTASPTPTPTISCPYQGVDDDQTIVNLIQAEALASNTKDMSIIQDIFSPDAVFHDFSSEPSRIWIGPIARYKDDLFFNTDLRKVEHFDILPAGKGIVGDRATYTSGSSGEYKNGDNWIPFSNGSSKTAAFGSEHWILGKNSFGCWVIQALDFNASHVQFP